MKKQGYQTFKDNGIIVCRPVLMNSIDHGLLINMTLSTTISYKHDFKLRSKLQYPKSGYICIRLLSWFTWFN